VILWEAWESVRGWVEGAWGKMLERLEKFGLSLMSLERKYRRLGNLTYLKTSCIIVSQLPSPDKGFFFYYIVI
jgi:hypothetical protein